MNLKTAIIIIGAIISISYDTSYAKGLKFITNKTSNFKRNERLRFQQTFKLVDYFTVSTGISRPKITSTFVIEHTNLALIHNFGIGKNYNKFFTFELLGSYAPEYYQKHLTIKGVDYSVIYTSLISMLNTYIHLGQISKNKVGVYLVGGVGAAYNSSTSFSSEPRVMLNQILSNVKISNKSDSFNIAWQIGAGFNFKINRSIHFSLSHRYINRGRFTIQLFENRPTTRVTNEISDHLTMASLNIYF